MDSSLVVSVVSHGHGSHIQTLLECLACEPAGLVARVVLTQNIPEPDPLAPAGGWPFVLEVRRNARPQGFGRNHNRALAASSEPFACVINPDVSWDARDGVLPALLAQAALPGLALAYPSQRDGHGALQDFERELPSFWNLLRRKLWGRREQRVEWVNAACWVLRQETWQRLGGFDEGFYMYCEDVELCLRLRVLGGALRRADVSIVHAGQRASRRSLRHGAWHVASLLRLWSRPVYWKAKALPLAVPALRGEPS
ncbi:MAG: glycosyl transferase [Burkholderiaceae bacterium]|jgi:GT2 family glycosyltransferase|nr:glycosyl transferase [Burkholderiaceae bacterium]